jgi:hypothetical protein
MKLVDSNSRETGIQLNSEDCIYARDLVAEFPYAVIGSTFIYVLSLAMSAVATPRAAEAVGGTAFVLWNGFLVWRTCFTTRDWTVAITKRTVLARIFRYLGRPGTFAGEPDVLELKFSDVKTLSIRVIDIIWSSIRRDAIRYLCIEPAADASGARLIAELKSFRDYQCGTPKHRLTSCQDGHLLIEWTFRRPPLDNFLQTVSATHPLVFIGTVQRESIDLRGFILQFECEKRSLLLRLKKLGFRQACTRMLMRRMRMSATDALKLMDGL